jgi:hypothetical protein
MTEFSDKTGNTLQEYPDKIETDYLLGIDNWGGWYYNPDTKSIQNCILEQENKDTPPELVVNFTMSNSEESENYQSITSLSEDLDVRSSVGKSIVVAKRLDSCGFVLTEAQARVYCLRDVYNMGRRETAKLLRKTPSTIDTQRARARKKISEAKDFVEVFTEEIGY